MESTLDELRKSNYPTYISRTKSSRQLLCDLRRGEVWLAIAAVTAWLASVFMVVKFFVSGDLHYTEWTDYQWSQAALGMGITAIITAAQWFLYNTGKEGPAALIATCVVIFFGMFSEISQGMEREDATVKSRSESSEVFQAALGAVTNLSKAPSISPAASSELIRAREKAARTQTEIDNKNQCNGCVGETFRQLRAKLSDAKGRVAAAQARADMEMKSMSANNAASLTSTLTLAKELEYDETNHYGMMRFLKNLFNVEFITASFLFVFIVIGTFEYAFHYVGGYVNDHRKALELLGRDSNGRKMQDVRIEDAMDDEKLLRKNLGAKPTDDLLIYKQRYTPDDIPSQPCRDTRDTVITQEGNQSENYTTKIEEAILNGTIKTVGKRADGEMGGFVQQLDSSLSKPEVEKVLKNVFTHLIINGLVVKREDWKVGETEYVIAPTTNSSNKL